MLGEEFESTLLAAQSGGEWAWSRLYHSVARQVLGYLRAQGARDAEDLLGEVFVHLARRIGDFSGTEAGFRSWVFTIAHHRVIDERRSKRRHPVDPVDTIAEEVSTAPSPTDEVLESLSTSRVQELLAPLAPAQRDVMMLRIIGGLTVAEIADLLGRSVGGVKALQRRAIAALRRHLERQGVPL